VISELRKGACADANVRRWFAERTQDQLYLSVLVIGELRRGIESIARRDKSAARALESRPVRRPHDQPVFSGVTPRRSRREATG
jgi:predicted nucleic acid-binding protein